MKKIILKLLILIFVSVSIFSDATVQTPGEFKIKGYKINREEGTTLTVVDALTGSLNEIKDKGSLSVDGYYTLGNAATTTASTVDDIAFSYRVSGNIANNYTVKIIVKPFIHESDKSVIDTKYFLINETVRFLDSNSSQSSDYKEKEGLIIEDSDDPADKTIKQTGVLSETTSSHTLVDKFDVKGAANKVSDDIWIARGAVAFVIDETSFDDAIEGKYKASIEISLSPEE